MPIVDPGWCWARSPSAPTAAFASARRSRRAPATPREAGQGGGHRRHGHRRPAVSGSDSAGRRARQPVRGRVRRVRSARCPRVLAEVLEDVLADLWSGERFAAAAGPCAATRSPSWPSPRPRIPLWVACTWPNGGRCGAPPLGRGGGRLAESPGSWERMEPDQVAKLAEIRRRRTSAGPFDWSRSTPPCRCAERRRRHRRATRYQLAGWLEELRGPIRAGPPAEVNRRRKRPLVGGSSGPREAAGARVRCQSNGKGGTK